jgi:anion transporter
MKLGFKPIPLAISIALTVGILLLPVPEGVKPEAWKLLAMFVGVISAIIGKVMPLGAVSIVAVALVAFTGVTADTPSKAINDALSAFSNQLIWLIAISIMISRGLTKTGLGARIGYWFIAIWGKRTIGIGYSLVISELLLAPVTPSNTARCGGIIHPIMKSIATSYDSDEFIPHTIRRRYLRSIHYAKSATRASTYVEDSASALHTLYDALDQLFDLRNRATHSHWHGHILGIHRTKQLLGCHLIQILIV